MNYIVPSRLPYVEAATYTLAQTSWAGGADATATSTHTSNRTGWTKYESASSSIATSTELTITTSTTSASVTETNDTDFGAGTTASSSVIGTGDAARIELATTTGATYSLTGGSWSYRRQITFDNGSSSENLTNFPVLVKLTSSTFGFSSTSTMSTGTDIRFTDSDGSTELSYEIERWASTTDGAYVWVKVPQINGTSTSDSIYMYYGNASAADAQNATSVWSNNYEAVWHLKEVPDNSVGQIKDSTANAHNGQSVATPTQITSQIGKGISLDGTETQEIDAPDSANFEIGTNKVTWEAWVKSADTLYDVIIHRQDAANFPELYLAYNGAFLFFYHNGVDAATVLSYTSSVGSSNEWYHIAIVRDDTDSNGVNDEYTLYINGSSTATSDRNATDNANNIAGSLALGGWTVNSTMRLIGSLDEVRLSTTGTARTASWIRAQYKSMSNTFNTLGSEAQPSAAYATSSTFTSQIIDTTANTAFGTVSWNATTTASTTVSIRVRSSNSATMSGATAFSSSSCTDITSGEDISGSGCVTDGNRYIQYQVTIGSNWYVSTATVSYDSKSFNVGAQETNPLGLFFKPDGTKMYVVGVGTDDVEQYSLSTAWDVSTASYDSKSFDVNAQETDPAGLFFKPDGTKMYVVGINTYDVEQYSLSTAWDVSTASYDSKSFDVNAQEIRPTGLFFKPDGTKMYVVGFNTDDVEQYSLSTAWDVSTASYDNANFRVATQEASPYGLFFKPDGTKMYVVGVDTDDVEQYSLAANSSNATTSAFHNITINYSNTVYTTSTQTLTSNPFNMENSAGAVTKISWSETLPGGTDVKFQIRTAPDSGGNPGTWGGWSGPTNSSDYYTDPAGGETIVSSMRDGVSDQWIQFRAFIIATSTATPTLSDVTVQYVINVPPQFDQNYGTNGVTVEQLATSSEDGWGSVRIIFSARDTDTSSGTGSTTVMIEYSLDGGSTWASTTNAALNPGATTSKTMSETLYSATTTVISSTSTNASWNAKAQVTTYTTTAKIRITLNDGDALNNVTSTTSGNFTLDTTNPTSTSFTLDSSSSSDAVNINFTDNTNIQYRFSSTSIATSSDAVAWTSAGATSVSGSSTVSGGLGGNASSGESVYYQVRDAFGNYTTGTAVAPGITGDNQTRITIKDTSNPTITNYREFISWRAYVATSGATFSAYDVFRSTTTNTAYTLLATITDSATNYYTDDGVVNGTTYYYKVRFRDTDGDVSAFSAEATDAPDGQGGTDVVTPTITSIATSTVQTTWATVTWTTDELATSAVRVGTSALSYNTTST
ncbi:MAG: DUF2341 domain-containing protein, partial [bacterium]|nr:DUF2341 domain-containing protein [bacterium]